MYEGINKNFYFFFVQNFFAIFSSWQQHTDDGKDMTLAKIIIMHDDVEKAMKIYVDVIHTQPFPQILPLSFFRLSLSTPSNRTEIAEPWLNYKWKYHTGSRASRKWLANQAFYKLFFSLSSSSHQWCNLCFPYPISNEGGRGYFIDIIFILA